MVVNTNASQIDTYIFSFERSLAARNYKPMTLRTYRCTLRSFGGLMKAEGMAASALTPDSAAELARRLTTRGKSQAKPIHLVRRFAEHLIEIGVAAPLPISAAQAERAVLLSDFEGYLLRHRGLSPRTIYGTLRIADRFLEHRFGIEMIDLPGLKAVDVMAFVEHLYGRKVTFRAKSSGTHLRSFFQYVFARGATATNLSLCMPRIRKTWGQRLPRYLAPDDVEKVLASVRTNPRRGARDYAMLLLMARLGLRAQEVVAIQLDDVEWRVGELLVRGKGQQYDRLPLPQDVGEAISDYLQRERTSAVTRTLFVTHRAPKQPFKGGQVINGILKSAFAATSVTPPTPYVGSHVLRHSLATGLVRAGASLEEVSDLLRHRSRATTMIYAKLDTEGLRSIAQSWPVGEAAR